MRRIIVLGAIRNAGRTAGTVMALALGVAVLACALALGSGLRNSTATAAEARWAAADVVAAAPSTIGSAVAASSTGIAADDAAVVGALPDVAAVAGVASGPVTVVDEAGRPLGRDGVAAAETWVDDQALASWSLVEGRSARLPGEVVLDAATAAGAEVAVGDRLTLTTPDQLDVVVVGLLALPDGGRAPSTTVALAPGDAAIHLAGPGGSVDLVLIELVAGVDAQAAEESIAAVLPDTTQVRSGAAHAAAAATTAARRLQVVDAVLGGMTAVALAVAAIGSANVLSLSAARRAREVALLRAVGASRSQILLAGVLEHAVLGLLAGIAGLALAAVLAWPAAAAARSLGIGPDGALSATPNLTTAVVSLVVGVAVAIVAGLRPAWQASRMAPVQAVAATALPAHEADRAPRWPAVVVAVGLAGVVAGGLGSQAGLVGGGALLLLLGVALAAAEIVRAVLTPLGGAVRRVGGAPGELAWQLVVRERRRTAGAATALLVSAALVATVGVLSQSLHTAVLERTARSVQADLVVQARSYDGAGLPPDLGGRLADLPEVARTATLGLAAGRVGGEETVATIADGRELAGLLAVEVVDGDLADVTGSAIAIDAGRAAARGWTVGSTVEVAPPGRAATPRRIAATFASGPGDGIGTVVVPPTAWDDGASGRGDVLVLVALADGVASAVGRAAVVEEVGDRAVAAVLDPAAYALASAGDVAPIVQITLGLLAVAVIAALLGVGNTMVLAVSERARDIGLLRAIGQTRRQVQAMVCGESAMIAGLGTTVGVLLGTVVGWASVRVLAAELAAARVDVPVLALAGVIAAGVAAGVAAAALPAVRAARVPVLTAIARD